MPRRYTCRPTSKGVRTQYSAFDVQDVLALLAAGRTLKYVSGATGIPEQTLYRARSGCPKPKGQVTSNMVFTKEQEKQLADYFRASSSMFYGLSTKEGRKLAYKFTTRLEVNFPNSWKQTNSVQSTKQCPSSRCAF